MGNVNKGVALFDNESVNKDYFDLDDALADLEAMEATQTDVNIRANEVVFGGANGKLHIENDGSSYRMTETAHNQMLSRLGIPGLFASRIPMDLLSTNINRLLNEYSGKNKWKIRTRELNNERYIRAIVTEKYKVLNDSEVIRNTQKYVDDNKSEIDNWGVSWGEDMMRITGKMPIEIAPKNNVGDITKVGIAIGNGTTGITSLKVNTYLYRLVCSNGMVVPESIGGIRKAHVGKEFDAVMNEGFDTAFASVTAVADMWNTIAELNLSDASANKIQRIREKVEIVIGRKETREIFERNIENNNTVYTLLNDLTYRARAVENPIERNQLESYAGLLMAA